MGLFNSIKDLFKSKEVIKEAKQDNLLNPSSPEIKEVKVEDRRYVERKCEICQGIIGEERWSKYGNLYFHKACAKKKKREVMNGG